MNEFQSLLVEQTIKTPLIDLNQLTGELIFSGKSIPENAAKVYEPALNWVSEYILNARPTTNFRFKIEYFNTSSSLWLAKILKVLIRIKEPDYVLIIHVYLPLEDYDEIEGFGDMKEAFFPILDIFQSTVLSIGIQLYGMDDKGETVKDKLVFI